MPKLYLYKDAIYLDIAGRTLGLEKWSAWFETSEWIWSRISQKPSEYEFWLGPLYLNISAPKHTYEHNLSIEETLRIPGADILRDWRDVSIE